MDLSVIEKIKRYIRDNDFPNSRRYNILLKEVYAMQEEMGPSGAVILAFCYGRSKGYRAAKAEVKMGQSLTGPVSASIVR